MKPLGLNEMVAGLERYQGSYDALDVYLADVDRSELTQDIFVVGGRRYRLEVKEDLGVLRVRRDDTPRASGEVLGALAGAGIVLLTNSKPKPEVVIGATVLGMLVGAALLPGQPDSPRKVMTMRFDTSSRAWQAYSGALVGTMKEQLGRAH